jgi:hypothetical protein
MAANLAVWAYDYLIMQPYVRVSPATWKNNLQKGMEWDDSDFFTNQILHPYHGGAYYTGARAYGFSWWESLLFTGFGSLVWEYFGERDLPSTNDFIVTTMGGAAFGEAGYRLAEAFSRSRDTGARGALREFAAWVVNPMYKLNELVFGEPFVERNRLPWTHLDLILRGGLAYAYDDDKRFNERFSSFPHAYIGAHIIYGNPWDDTPLYGLYDFFTVKIDGEVDWLNPSWDIFADALLCGVKLFPGREARGILGLYQQFDYLENLVYKFSANGMGAGYQMRIPFAQDSAITLNAYFYGVVLGILDSRYSRWEINNRDAKGAGWSYKLGLRYLIEGRLSLSLDYYYYWLHILDGADWKDIVRIFTSSLEVPLEEGASIGFEARCYNRWSDAGYDNAWAWSFKTYIAFHL